MQGQYQWAIWSAQTMLSTTGMCGLSQPSPGRSSSWMLRSGSRGTISQPLLPAVCGDQGAPYRRVLKGAETWSPEQEEWGGVLISQQTGGVSIPLSPAFLYLRCLHC